MTDSYQDFMVFYGVTDKHRGRLYYCPICGKDYWSAWGQARRHYEKVMAKLKKEREGKECGVGMEQFPRLCRFFNCKPTDCAFAEVKDGGTIVSFGPAKSKRRDGNKF